MVQAIAAALAAFLSSPFGLSQAFIAPTDSQTRLAVVRPIDGPTRDDAKKFLAQMDSIRLKCRTNNWELKSTLFNGLRAGQTTIDPTLLASAMKEQGFDRISVVTCEFQALDKGKEFNRISFMFIYGQDDAAKWRLIEIEPLEMK